MRSEGIVQHLLDILENIAHIQRITASLRLQDYMEDRDKSAAVERYLQIITEAAYRLGDDAAMVCPGPDWKSWRDLGNVLRHAYHRIDPVQVWATISEDIPELQQFVRAALASRVRDIT